MSGWLCVDDDGPIYPVDCGHLTINGRLIRCVGCGAPSVYQDGELSDVHVIGDRAAFACNADCLAKFMEAGNE